MAEQEKRIHELIETADKTDKFIALDAAGLAEAVKYDANNLIDKALTDTLYVKLVGSESVTGVKTWANQGVFQAGINVTAGVLTAGAGIDVTAGDILNAGSYVSKLDGTSIKVQKTDSTSVVELGHDSTNLYGYLDIKDDTGATKALIRGDALSGVQAYFIGGYVGIGIISPERPLHVLNNGINVQALFERSTVNTDASIAVKNNATTYTIGIDGSDNDKFKISNNLGLGINDRFVIDLTGNIGIGTTNPNAKLTVAGGVSMSGALDTTITGSVGLRMGVINTVPSNNTNAFIGVHNSGGIGNLAGDIVMMPRSTVTNCAIRFLTGNTNAIERLSILSNGNIGIGITNPSNLLNVKNDSTTTTCKIENTNTGGGVLSVVGISSLHGTLTLRVGSTATERFSVRGDGAVYMPNVFDHITAIAANLYIISGGRLYRSTSSKKAKYSIKRNVDPALALQFKPISYKDKNTKKSLIGFIAEEMNEIDTRFANNQEEEGLMGIDINCIVAALTATVQKQNLEIIELQKAINKPPKKLKDENTTL